MIEWIVILTIGCLPKEEQPPGANCVLETKRIEAKVFDEATADNIIETLPKQLPIELPGSFVVARKEKRVKEEPKQEEEK